MKDTTSRHGTSGAIRTARRRPGRGEPGWTRWAVAVPVLLVTLAACGAEPERSEVPSAGGGKKASAEVENEIDQYIESVGVWAKCMRKEGFPYTDPDSKGRTEFEGDGRKAKTDPKFTAAHKACEKHSKPVPEELERRNAPKLSAKEIKKRQEYSRCMQEQGSPDFPEIDAEGTEVSQEWDQNTSGAKRASRICEPILGNPTIPPSERKG
ncbi:hypothetical protein [Streptomyces uncialis]|uniref:hypothetical protein n=1 Tax=Streptomyces uncialis TaxID=1048205 RepID=UPI0009A0EB88|nr:hypothetical protein [Streptomyces uncialis]MCX4663572.1 hypothetical protein [Streptomyces uncialis]WTE10618.1 hypothetical protein OG924_10130 [Streptomyces uncialis]